MKKLVLKTFFTIYVFFRALWSLVGGPKQVCPFFPTCGEYARICYSTLPFHKALFYSTKRLLSCHPWQKGSIDYPPKK